MKEGAIAFFSALLFAIGLVVSGMTLPAKVIGFLDPFGAWDPSLALVMVGAIAVHALAYRFIKKRGTTMSGGKLRVPLHGVIDARLLIGSALFGVGWGLGGVCPGPGLVGMMSAASPFLMFVGAMFAGMALFSLWEAARARGSRPSTPM